MGKQKIITTYVPAPKAVDFNQFTDKWSGEGWIVKQISTSPIEVKDGRDKGNYLAVTFLLEKNIED